VLPPAMIQKYRTGATICFLHNISTQHVLVTQSHNYRIHWATFKSTNMIFACNKWPFLLLWIPLF